MIVVAPKSFHAEQPVYLVRGPLQLVQISLDVRTSYPFVDPTDRYSCGGFKLSENVWALPTLCPESEEERLLVEGVGPPHEGGWVIPFPGGVVRRKMLRSWCTLGITQARV